MRIRGLIISAVKSGSGKTIASLSVMNLLKEAGYDVIPFKTGPDFIDTSHYKYVCGLDGRNLDTFFMKKSFILWNIMDAIKEMKAKNPFIVIEGAMGLFDGYGEKGAGSTAELAKLLNLPVVLVVDAKGMGQSVSALVAGFKGWDRKVNIACVLLNNVGSEKHFDLLKKGLEKTDARPIGYIKRDESLSIPSRHLGISMGYERDKKLDDALKSAKEGLDKKKIEDISGDLNLCEKINIPIKRSKKRIYIAFDEAFCFCYKENIRLLSEAGDVRFFSPLMDKSLDLPDFIYLPGGYPELFADKLSENKNMMGYIKDYVKNGGYLLAECGGLIYLSKSLSFKGKKFNFCGVFPFEIEMAEKFSSLGYVEVETKNSPLFGNTKFRGHRFHYSFISKEHPDLDKTYILKRKENIESEGYTYKRAVGSYVHLHFGSNIRALERMVNRL